MSQTTDGRPTEGHWYRRGVVNANNPDQNAARDHALAIALSRKAILEYVAQGDPFAVPHTVQITSCGGSGTTALTDNFVDAGLSLPRGPGQWPHKHQRVPPAADVVPEGFRVVYVLGDPRDAVLSVFRRGIQVGHWTGLHHYGEDVPVPAALDSLAAFVEKGEDLFALDDHVQQWLDHPPGYPVMFLRFNRVDEAWDDVAEFVGLPHGTPRLSFESRHSDWRSEAPVVRDMLDSLYGGLAERIDQMPASMIVNP